MPGGRGRRSLPGIGTRGAWMAPAGCFLPVSCSGLRKPCPCSAPGRMGGFRKNGSSATVRICLTDERAEGKGRGCRICDEAGLRWRLFLAFQFLFFQFLNYHFQNFQFFQFQFFQFHLSDSSSGCLRARISILLLMRRA